MGKQLFIGLAVEGNTDMRFLESVVQRTFMRIAFDRISQDIDISVFPINVTKVRKSFPEFVASASQEGVKKYGILLMAIHADSDKETIQQRIEDKFNPAQRYLDELDCDEYCKIMVPVIPMRMIESWMMADIQLLKDEMGTDIQNIELGFHRFPETIADPKALIEEAIRTVQQSLPKKRRTLSIGELYGILGDKLSYDSLWRLPSYQTFVSSAIKALRMIGYLPEE